MRKATFIKSIAWGIILGIISVGISLRIGKFLHPNQLLILMTVIIAVLILAIIIASAVIIIRQQKRMSDMLKKGSYNDLILDLQNKHDKLKDKFGYKNQYAVGIANCYTRMGKFQESLDHLQQIHEDSMDDKIKAGYYILYSENLYFLNRDLTCARALINKSSELLVIPETTLLMALIELELGNKEDAEKLINHYLNDKSERKVVVGLYSVLYIDKFTSNVFEKFLLGLYYFKIGQGEIANKYFSEASNCEYKNYFSGKSKEYINQALIYV